MKTNDFFSAHTENKTEIIERPRVKLRNLNNALMLTIIMVLGVVGISKAQLSEGTYMLGTDLGSGITSTASNGLFGFNFGLNEGAGFNLGLAPKVGYFVSDNFMLGAVANLGFTKAAESEGASESTLYGI